MALADEGLIGGAGLSNHPIELMERALTVGPIAVVQHQHSLLSRDADRDGVPDWCALHGIPFLAWSPLASGFLADGFDLDALDAADLRRGLRWATGADAISVRSIRAVLGEIAHDRACAIAAVALSWVTSRSGRHAILGARSPAEVDVVRSLPELQPHELERLERA